MNVTATNTNEVVLHFLMPRGAATRFNATYDPNSNGVEGDGTSSWYCEGGNTSSQAMNEIGFSELVVDGEVRETRLVNFPGAGCSGGSD
ncbi:hypothetical protein EPO34_04160 [Patescibacteria group bacterium]|nr:MAG: hypothetical protein EPO34_04160 [Patescibacteria group bacterium]